MKRMIRAMGRRLWADADDCCAATAVEYAVVLGLIVLTCISAVHALGGWNSNVFTFLVEGF